MSRLVSFKEFISELSVPQGTTGKRKTVSTPMVAIRMASGKIEKHPPGKSGSSGGGGEQEIKMFNCIINFFKNLFCKAKTVEAEVIAEAKTVVNKVENEVSNS